MYQKLAFHKPHRVCQEGRCFQSWNSKSLAEFARKEKFQKPALHKPRRVCEGLAADKQRQRPKKGFVEIVLLRSQRSSSALPFS
jgi:hypothetical protein